MAQGTSNKLSDDRAGLLGCFAIVAVFLLLFRSCSCRSESPAPPALSHKIINAEVQEKWNTTLIRYDVVVTGTITEQGLRDVLQQQYEESKLVNRGGKPNGVRIYLYTSREHYESNFFGWIAMLSGKGDDIDITVQSHLIDGVNAKPEERLGLSEETRKQIYKEFVAAQDRAYADERRAEEEFNKELDLRDQYEREVAKKFGVTSEQLDEICSEASEKNWPMPPFTLHER